MRIVSMVPSWTETLLNAGLQVVGRTRYCIHPPQKITVIPVVGGTKDVSWELVADLKPDIVLFDEEENPLEMAETCPFPWVATKVHSLGSLQTELIHLGEIFKNSYLLELSHLCRQVIEAPVPKWNPRKIPGFMDWVQMPHGNEEEAKRVLYLIWRKPWMAAGSGTYIGSVLKKMGAELVDFEDEEKYPVLEAEDYSDCFFLFSSEPYPFVKKLSEIKEWAQEIRVEGAIVDGEFYSWFGDRSLRYLAKTLSI